MRIFNTLFKKIGDMTLKYSNLPESYVKRSFEQVYWRTPKGYPQYRQTVVARKKYRFTTNRPWTIQFRLQNEPGTNRKKVFQEPVGEWIYFRGDRVEVMVGRDKGKQGIVTQVIQERNWVIVEGLNTHLRTVGKEKKFPGIVVRSEAPLLVNSQVKLVDPETLKPTDVQWRYTEEGEKVRVCTTSGRILPLSKMSEETYDYKTPSAYIENQYKDTPAATVTEITFKPQLKTFEMEILENAGIEESREPAPSYWY